MGAQPICRNPLILRLPNKPALRDKSACRLRSTKAEMSYPPKRRADIRCCARPPKPPPVNRGLIRSKSATETFRQPAFLFIILSINKSGAICQKTTIIRRDCSFAVSFCKPAKPFRNNVSSSRNAAASFRKPAEPSRKRVGRVRRLAGRHCKHVGRGCSLAKRLFDWVVTLVRAVKLSIFGYTVNASAASTARRGSTTPQP